jgi:beta-phosphoglucomutase-like phosphatase (HAD superfamily)
MLKAILFDSDGVLVDTERIYFESTRLAFKAAGVRRGDVWAKWYLGKSKLPQNRRGTESSAGRH